MISKFEMLEEFVFLSLQRTLIKMGFKKKIPGKQYSRFNLSEILVRDDYRIDLFNKVVCGSLSLSCDMIKRSRKIFSFKKVNVYLLSLEDVFVFKSITERPGDLDDSVALVKTGLIITN